MNLGVDLEVEILLRLPVKSLMRFKCVQRSWNKLIKSSNFVKRRNKLCIPQNCSLLIIKKSKLSLLSCDSDNEKPILITSLFPKNITRIEFYGSCNGVFCLKGTYPDTSTSHDELILWNPTNEVHRIPRSRYYGKRYMYGFCAAKDDFKVVKLNERMFCPLSEVYNLSTKSWKTVDDDVPRGIMITHEHPSRYNVLVNGVYHWITSSFRYNDGPANILCFNFHTNQFRQLKGPSVHEVYCDQYVDDIIEIKGSLGYVLQNKSLQNKYLNKVQLDIWVMDENTWAKKYTINISMSSFHGFGNDGAEILGGNVGQLLKSYDYDGDMLRQFQINISKKGFRIYEYVPSLALLSN